MKFQLVDAWAVQLKNKVSIKLAAAFAVAMTLLTANPSLLLGLINFMPTGIWRTALAGGVGFIVFALPTLASLVKQPKMEAKIEEKKNADPDAN